MSDKIKWWGYVHVSGTLHAKRYFSERDIREAKESPFVDTVHGPFEADDSEHARQILAERAG